MKPTSQEAQYEMKSSMGLLLIWLVSGLSAAMIQAGPVTETPTWRGLASPFSTDDEVLDFLRTARVVSKKRIRKGINQPFKVQLEKDGVKAAAVSATSI